MEIMDAFNPEDWVSVTFSTFYKLMKEASDASSKMQYIENALNAGVPEHYILGMLDGKTHPNSGRALQGMQLLDDVVLARSGPLFGGEESEIKE